MIGQVSCLVALFHSFSRIHHTINPPLMTTFLGPSQDPTILYCPPLWSFTRSTTTYHHSPSSIIVLSLASAPSTPRIQNAPPSSINTAMSVAAKHYPIKLALLLLVFDAWLIVCCIYIHHQLVHGSRIQFELQLLSSDISSSRWWLLKVACCIIAVTKEGSVSSQYSPVAIVMLW
jgi:hypothetical protein